MKKEIIEQVLKIDKEKTRAQNLIDELKHMSILDDDFISSIKALEPQGILLHAVEKEIMATIKNQINLYIRAKEIDLDNL